jgi:hypothetical protein
MQKIKLMSDEVPQIQAHRKSRKNNIKRTFVTAKDATHAKYTKTEPKTTLGNQPIRFVSARPTIEPLPFKIDINHKNTIKDENGWDTKDKMEWNRYVQESTFDNANKSMFIKLSETQRTKNLRSLLRDVIIFESNEENDTNYCLNKTTACMRKIGKLDLKFDSDKITYFYIFNDQIIAEGKGETKKLAKKAVDEDLLNVLRTNCYTIRSKLKFYSGEEIIKKNVQNKPNIPATDQIKQDNLGFKLLEKLGWKGGSLGAHGTGIIDPINLEIKIGKKGLGSDMDHFDQNYFRNLLKNFKKNDLEYDLIFSPEFSKEERAQIHQ